MLWIDEFLREELIELVNFLLGKLMLYDRINLKELSFLIVGELTGKHNIHLNESICKLLEKG